MIQINEEVMTVNHIIKYLCIGKRFKTLNFAFYGENLSKTPLYRVLRYF